MKLHWIFWPAIILPFPIVIVFSVVLIMLLPDNRFRNKLQTNVPNTKLRNAPLYSFTLFLIVLLTTFIKQPISSKYLIIFIILFISLSEIINVVTSDSRIFYWMAASVPHPAGVNPNVIKAFLASI